MFRPSHVHWFSDSVDLVMFFGWGYKLWSSSRWSIGGTCGTCSILVVRCNTIETAAVLSAVVPPIEMQSRFRYDITPLSYAEQNASSNPGRNPSYYLKVRPGEYHDIIATFLVDHEMPFRNTLASFQSCVISHHWTW